LFFSLSACIISVPQSYITSIHCVKISISVTCAHIDPANQFRTQTE